MTLAFLSNLPIVRKYDFISLPGVDVWGVLMRKDSLLAAKKNIKSEDLLDLPLLCSNQTMVSNQISGWIKRDFEQLNIVAIYNLLFNASLLVEEGLGYALMLDKIINNDKLCFIPLKPRLNIVWKKYQIFSKPAELFLQRLQEEIGSN